MLTEVSGRSRRRMLKYSVCSFFLGALGLPIVRRSSETSTFAQIPDAGTLLPDSLREIGEEYLNNHPAERSRSILLSSIQSRLNMIDVSPDSPSWAELEKVILDDFHTDDVVYLKGWALSHTEARLAALFIV